MDLRDILQRMEAALGRDLQGDPEGWRDAAECGEEWWNAVVARDATHTDAADSALRSNYGHLARELSKRGPRRITTTFDEVTPESAEEGDTSDAGWDDFVGQPMEGPDAPDDEMTAIENAVEFIRRESCVEASSSSFHDGVWYVETDGSTDYRTGTERRRSFHLDGPWNVHEEREIFDALTKRR